MAKPRRVRLDDSGMPIRKADVGADTPGVCDCPRLEPEDWDAVESDWSDIAFVKLTTNAVLGVPVGYDSVRNELRTRAEKLGASVPADAMLLNGEGRFRRPVMLEIEGAPPTAKDIVRPGGVAFTRLLEAPWGTLGKAAEDTRKEARAKYGRPPDEVWVWYLTCRECSRERNFETLVVAHYRVAP